MDGLLNGRLKVDISLPRFGSCGSPQHPWVFVKRRLPFNFIHLPKRGRIKFSILGRESLVEPGGFLWMSSEVEHDMSQSDVRQPVVMYHMRIVIRTVAGVPCRLPEDSFILPHALGLHRIYEGWFAESGLDSPYAAAIGQGLIIQTFGQLFAGLQHSLGGRRLTARQQQRIREYCDSRLTNSPTPGELAEYLHLSTAYMARLFRTTFGKTPKSWLADERMRLASALLVETSRSISDVASEIGYSDIYAFSRQFSHSVGCSPTTFRARYRAI